MKDIQPNIRVVAEEEDMRRWDKMPHDILVTIIKRVPCHYGPAFDLGYAYICHSWQLAVLEVLFPPDKTLDLRCLDSYPWNFSIKFFRRYLMLALNSRPASAWTTLYLPNKAIFVERYYRQVDTIILEDDLLTLIAGKTPQLRNLYVPQAQALSRQLFLKLVPNWKNLSKVQIDISDYSFSALETNCRFIRELSLYGWMMNAHLASRLAKCFPNLKSLEISGCIVPNKVLGIILKGHNNLELLDSQPYFYRFASEGDQLRVNKQMKNIQSSIRVVAEKGDMRRWDKMPHDILVTIIKRLTCHYSPAFDLSYAYICRSWQLAVLDVLFPPDKTLDLRCLDSYPWNCSTKFFRRYLMLALNRRPASAWTTLYLPNKAIFVERYYRQVNTIILEDDLLTLIAGKTPQLRNLYVPQVQALSRQLFLKLVSNWKNLSKVQIDISDYSFSALETNCRFIRELSLYGWMMNANLASKLAKCFPNLKSLEICGCIVPNRRTRSWESY